jgi:prepilin-type N-terminal cleavage/methylation domain-containing protein
MQNKINLKNKGGYTLIEMMVAISLFLIIVTLGMGALLNASSLHNKSKDMRSIMDSLSFTIDDMSRNLRTGTNYHCIDNTVNGTLTGTNNYSCAKGGGISFLSSPPSTQWIYYIGTYNGVVGIFKSTDGGNTFVKLNPDQVTIDTTNSYISVFGAETAASGDIKQPFVTIHLSGTIQYQSIITTFSLQTSVSQRQIDI